MVKQVAISSLESPDHAMYKDHKWFACTWFIGKRCNYDCSYCSALEHDNISSHVTFDVIQSMVSQIKEHIKNRGKKFKMSITGGEPFVHPKFLDVLKLLREELNPSQLSIVTNGSVPVAKYLKASKYITHLTFSYHLERNDKELKCIYETVKEINKTDVNVTITLMFLPGKLNEIKELVKRFIDDNIKYSIRDIEPNFTETGRMVQPYEPGYELTKHIKDDEWFRFKNRQNNVKKSNEKYYSQEERDYLESTASKTTWSNVRVQYQDGSSVDTHTDELIKRGNIDFKNWLCYVGVDHMYVDWDGRVWTALCRQGGVIGNIHSKINFPKEPVKCFFDYCRCNTNVWTRKYKEDKYRNLVTSE